MERGGDPYIRLLNGGIFETFPGDLLVAHKKNAQKYSYIAFYNLNAPGEYRNAHYHVK